MSETVRETVCPICREHNRCQAHETQACWCNQVVVPRELLDLVAKTSRNKSCICLDCIEAFRADRDGFVGKYF